jgi:crotonobetainyl-CoA:carnitine CoA-transferase CaiB-like acyl-CoA transferase
MLGDFEVPGFALRFSDYPERLELEAPTLGQHNASVLSHFLGYSADRIRALESGGVLQSARR